MTAAVISCAAVSDAHVVVRPLKWLGAEFGTFKRAMRGGVFDGESKSYLVPRHAWPIVYGQIVESGLLAKVDERAGEWLAEARERESTQDTAALDRIATLDARLRSEGKALRPYQLTGIRWLAAQRAALLLDEMGVGKSVQSICAIPEGVPVIVECPASLRLMWRDELRKWRPDLVPVVCPALGSWPTAHTCGGYSAYIVSEGWVRDTHALMQSVDSETPRQPLASSPPQVCPPQVYLISDECQRFKGRSKRTAAMQEVCAAVRRAGGTTVGLSGTPLMNRPAELYTLFLIFGCARKAFASWTEYTRLWNARKGRFKETIWGAPSAEVAERIKSVSLRRTRAEVLPELPAKTHQAIASEASARMKRRLDAAEDAIGVALGLSASEAPLAKRSLAKLKLEDLDKVAALTEYTALRVALADEKIPDMLEWIKLNSVGGLNEDDGSPLVVFSMHRAPVEACAKLDGWRVITGDVTTKQRHDIVSDFQAGRLSGVAITVQSGGVGLTLTRSHRALFVDRSFTPPDNWQAEDRVCRFGQDSPVLISRLVTDHRLERRLDEILDLKSAMIAAAMGETSDD